MLSEVRITPYLSNDTMHHHLARSHHARDLSLYHPISLYTSPKKSFQLPNLSSPAT